MNTTEPERERTGRRHVAARPFVVARFYQTVLLHVMKYRRETTIEQKYVGGRGRLCGWWGGSGSQVKEAPAPGELLRTSPAAAGGRAGGGRRSLEKKKKILDSNNNALLVKHL